MPKKILKGEVVSDKMEKTVVVKVDQFRAHPKYKKRYRISKRYKVDDPENKYKVGDKVLIADTRPKSKDKKWKVVKKK